MQPTQPTESAPSTQPERRAPAFNAWLDEFFAAYYRRRPVNATFTGVHQFDDRWPDFSPRGADETMAEMQSLLRRLRSLPPEPLTPAEALDRRLAEGFLEIGLWEYGSTHFHRGNPSLYSGEAVFGVMALFLRPFAPLARRVESAVARLAAMPALLEQGRENVRRAPLPWTERAIRECGGALAFLRDGIDILMADEGISDARLRQAADTAATAVAAYQHYLETELRAHPTDGYACGEEAFALMLRQGHALDRDAASVAAYAEQQMAVCASQLEARAADVGARSPKEALARLDGLHPAAGDYYARYGEVWQAARASAEQHGLLTWPDFPIRYVPRPRWARAAAPSLYFLYYRSPAPFDDVRPLDYLVMPIEPGMPPDEQERLLLQTNDSVIRLNHVVHHGGLGHHVQNYHAARAASRIGQVAAVDCAARIGMLCGGTMAEGWACYATDLMDEVGFLTPLEHYEGYQARLRMAARALVDIGLHGGRYSFDEAVAVYRDRAHMSPDAAHAEVVKNSMFPGAAVMYLMGTDGIHELRRDLTARAANRSEPFDLQRFHDRFLSYGSVPVSLIGAAMREETDSADAQ